MQWKHKQNSTFTCSYCQRLIGFPLWLFKPNLNSSQCRHPTRNWLDKGSLKDGGYTECKQTTQEKNETMIGSPAHLFVKMFSNGQCTNSRRFSYLIVPILRTFTLVWTKLSFSLICILSLGLLSGMEHDKSFLFFMWGG